MTKQQLSRHAFSPRGLDDDGGKCQQPNRQAH
jgi:hypothetical protein